MLSCKPAFSLSSFSFINRLFSSSLISTIRVVQFSSVAHSCLTLCDPMDCSLPGFSVLGIFQAIILEWIAIAEYIRQNTGLDEAQVEIRISKRNINSLRYADSNTLMAESKEELKSHLMKVKRDSEKAGLQLNIQKTKIMASSPTTSWQIDGKTMEQRQTLFSWAPK